MNYVKFPSDPAALTLSALVGLIAWAASGATSAAYWLRWSLQYLVHGQQDGAVMLPVNIGASSLTGFASLLSWSDAALALGAMASSLALISAYRAIQLRHEASGYIIPPISSGRADWKKFGSD